MSGLTSDSSLSQHAAFGEVKMLPCERGHIKDVAVLDSVYENFGEL